MKKFLVGLGAVALIVIVIGMVFMNIASTKVKKMLPSVENFIDDFYKNWNNQNYDYIYNTLADRRFKSGGSYDEFKQFMDEIYKKFGKIKSRKKIVWNLNYQADGLYFNINYTTNHDKVIATESFVLKEHNGSWLVANYQIASGS